MAVAKLKSALQQSSGRSKPWSGARLLNCFVEKADGDKRDDYALMATPGTTVFAAVGSSPIRGERVVGDLVYVVSGAELYSVDNAGSSTLLGMVGGGSGRVRMADNGTQICIADGGVPYVWDGTSLTTPVLPAAVSDVAYIDGYIIWTFDGTDQFIISSLDNALIYDFLDIATVEGAPDFLVGVIVDHREIQFYGKSTVEIWYNSGAADFPFERQGNAFIERGCFDRDSLIKIDNSVHFVGDDRIIYRLSGYDPQRISTHAIEYALRGATYHRGFVYTQEGHKFYGLWTDSGTFLYDMATGAWHERQSFGMGFWRMGGAFEFNGSAYFTDNQNGNIYLASLDVNDENGATISVQVELPTIECGDRSRITMHSFEVLCETGVGSTTVEPIISLQYSDDGGRNYSKEMQRTLGLVGSYRTRAIWRKLGQFRQRQMRITMTDSYRRFVIGYFADIR